MTFSQIGDSMTARKVTFPKVFVDTSFWIAKINSEDENHPIAQQWLKKIKEDPVILVTSDFVVIETLNFIVKSSRMATCGLSLKHRKDLAKKFYNSWFKFKSSYRELIHIDNEIWNASAEIYFRYMDKEFSFTDCTSFCLMEKHGIFQAATFDRHFSQAGKIVVT